MTTLKDKQTQMYNRGECLKKNALFETFYIWVSEPLKALIKVLSSLQKYERKE